MQLLDFLKAIDLPPRLGWIALLVGVAGLLFINYQVWPFATGEAITAPIAGLLCLLGAATLIVSFCGFVAQKAGDYLDDWKAKRSDRTEALANLNALTDLERRQLAWALRNGNQRFEGFLGTQLVSKRIVRPADGYGINNVWIINDAVWKMRDKLLTRFEHLPRDRNLPLPPPIY